MRFRDMLDKILIEVEDSGVSIARRISRVSSNGSTAPTRAGPREHGGTGLGLAIVKHIVEAHGEHITLRSESGAWAAPSSHAQEGGPERNQVNQFR